MWVMRLRSSLIDERLAGSEYDDAIDRPAICLGQLSRLSNECLLPVRCSVTSGQSGPGHSIGPRLRDEASAPRRRDHECILATGRQRQERQREQ